MKKTNYWFPGLAALLIFACDRAAKQWVLGHMAEGESIPLVPGFFHITFIYNPGAAFGFLPNMGWLFMVVSALLIGGIVFFRRQIASQPKFVQICVGLIGGGALGNLFDRFYIGKVVDFLDFRVWSYIFNIADSGIVVGGILLCLLALLPEPKGSDSDG